MKLSSLKPKVSKLVIKFPSGNDSDLVLSLISQDNKNYQLKLLAAMKNYQNKGNVDLEALLHDDNEVVAGCIVGWTGLQDDDGNDIPYSPDAALKLISDPVLLYIKEQVVAFTKDRTNFFRSTGESA